jgi:hypothetical protein
MRDRRIARLLTALTARFPGTTPILGPRMDDPDSGEVLITLLNAPTDPPTLVHRFAWTVIDELWGDEPVPVSVGAVSRADTAKYYAHRLPKPRTSRRRSPRRRAASSARK